MSTAGGALSITAHGALMTALGSPLLAVTVLGVFVLLAPVAIALALPETRGRPLDLIAPERLSLKESQAVLSMYSPAAR